MIFSIHFLRGIAALFVFIYHFYHILKIYEEISFPYLEVFHIGVDIFFVISGFIMVYIINKQECIDFSYIKSFVKARFIRIFPQYFVVSMLVFFVYIFIFSNPRDFTILTLLTSLLFIPYESIDGVYPVLGVGWTLNYEILFYSLIVLGLLFFKKFYYVFVVLLVFLFVLLGDSELKLSAPFSFWFNSILLEFLAGMFLGYFFKYKLFFNLYLVFLALSIFILLCVFYSNHAVLAFLIVYVVVSLENNRLALNFFKHKLVLLLGTISYPFYLIHQPIISFFGKIYHSLGFSLSFYSVGLFFGISFIVIAIVSSVFESFFERTVVPALKKI